MASLRDIIINRLSSAVQVSREAIASQTYLYPPLGISYLISHPALYPPVSSRILPCIILAVSVTVPMFLLTYIPQAAALTLVNGPLVGPINAVLLVLSESNAIVTFIAREFLLQGALTDIFDATLASQGQESLVSKGRELRPGHNRDGVHRLWKFLADPMNKFIPAQLPEYLLFLPMNFIPLIGTATFLLVQGREMGPKYHIRYFQLKGYDRHRMKEEVKRRRGGYTGFGSAAMALNLIPFASLLFTFTSTVGAALWAAELEKCDGQRPGEAADGAGNGAKVQK